MRYYSRQPDWPQFARPAAPEQPPEAMNPGAAAAAAAGEGTDGGGLRYLGREPLMTRGPRSGRVYSVERGAVLSVDPSDVEALLATQLFVRA